MLLRVTDPSLLIKNRSQNRCDAPIDICPTCFWLKHEIGANSFSQDQSLFLRDFFFLVVHLISQSQKCIQPKKQHPLFCHLCKRSSAYLAFSEEPLKVKEIKVCIIQLYTLVPSYSPGLQRTGSRVDEEEGRRSSVKEDGVGVSVGYLCHVFQYVLFSDDSQ